MGRRCCIAGCNSSSRLPEHQGVTFHSFPLDSVIRGIWMRNTRLNVERQITKSVLVCSRHFRRVDFHPQRSGKYLLKQRVFPTVFPWGKIDPAQVEEDLNNLKQNDGTSNSEDASATEDTTKATVEAKVAQIMAEAAELNAAASSKATSDTEMTESATPPPSGARFEAVTNFNPGVRLEAQDFDGNWHLARVVEVDNDDREVLIKFERFGKMKSAIDGTEEWIPMNSTRLRQKVSSKPVPSFSLEEKCMARWSGPRKFPGTVKKVIGNDTYEILFDDGYVKNVRAIHMSKVAPPETDAANETFPDSIARDTTISAVKLTKPEATGGADASTNKKRQSGGSRRDWPLLDLAKLDLEELNLPEIPHDGEWTCHWVNDQPIGREGFLVVGEHRKPTVVVQDWRLPPGWVKHMYQRSNVLGKWDVILVSPAGKRFRSKSDLKIFLEEQGQSYNPDIYDFSIHRRRAKDINAYVYTPDYTPQQTPKPKQLEVTLSRAASEAIASSLASSSTTHIETPVATPVPPLELMTPTPAKGATVSPETIAVDADSTALATTSTQEAKIPADVGYAYIGGLKVQIIDNLFRCPKEGCSKNFRKENHLQIHVKHYHRDLIKLLGACPKMQELAEKRTHKSKPEVESMPKNQIPNQEFFAKLHQQDLQHTRGHRRAPTASESPMTVQASTSSTPLDEPKHESETKPELDEGRHQESISKDIFVDGTIAQGLAVHRKLGSPTANKMIAGTPVVSDKRTRYVHAKNALGSRKSSRQRMTRSYVNVDSSYAPAPALGGDASFGASDFEETRHSFNTTPDAKVANSKRNKMSLGAPTTPQSGAESPVTADSGSFPFQPFRAPSSNEPDDPNVLIVKTQYIKENGEIIKIVHMRQEEIINCLCSYCEEDGLMIQCELCLCWQHGICNGIDKESDVPEKYVCYICRNPQRGRESMRYMHDQDWLYDGKLPTANYHLTNPTLGKRFELLKKTHTVTGNLLELKNFLHSLRFKISIVNNRNHPKLYLWAKKWDDESPKKSHAKANKETDADSMPPAKKFKEDEQNVSHMPNVPQPEAPIDPDECQQRLLEHIKHQQVVAMERLNTIEGEIDELERQDELTDLKDSDLSTTKEMLASFIRELDIVNQIVKLNKEENMKQQILQENEMASYTG